MDRVRVSHVVWLVIVATSAVRVAGIAGGYFWQDDFIHIWDALAGRFGSAVLTLWNGHFEPVPLAVQYVFARVTVQQWWPAVVTLGLAAVATSCLFWIAVRRWVGDTGPAAASAMTFAAWPALSNGSILVLSRTRDVGPAGLPGALALLPGRQQWIPAAIVALFGFAMLCNERALLSPSCCSHRLLCWGGENGGSRSAGCGVRT